MKTIVIHALAASFLASVAGIIYQIFYQSALVCDFSKLINPVSISMATTVGCLMMALGYTVLMNFRLEKYKGWINILISFLSVASIIGAMGTTLPLDLQSPELFPGLIAPLHLFPALSFFTLSTFFDA